MFRLLSLTLFVVSLTFTTTGCGRSGENTVIKPETTQTDEELQKLNEEHEAAMDTSTMEE